MNFLHWLCLLLIGLKLSGIINEDWFTVMSPIMIHWTLLIWGLVYIRYKGNQS